MTDYEQTVTDYENAVHAYMTDPTWENRAAMDDARRAWRTATDAIWDAQPIVKIEHPADVFELLENGTRVDPHLPKPELSDFEKAVLGWVYDGTTDGAGYSLSDADEARVRAYAAPLAYNLGSRERHYLMPSLLRGPYTRLSWYEYTFRVIDGKRVMYGSDASLKAVVDAWWDSDATGGPTHEQTDACALAATELARRQINAPTMANMPDDEGNIRAETSERTFQQYDPYFKAIWPRKPSQYGPDETDAYQVVFVPDKDTSDEYGFLCDMDGFTPIDRLTMKHSVHIDTAKAMFPIDDEPRDLGDLEAAAEHVGGWVSYTLTFTDTNTYDTWTRTLSGWPGHTGHRIEDVLNDLYPNMWDWAGNGEAQPGPTGNPATVIEQAANVCADAASPQVVMDEARDVRPTGPQTNAGIDAAKQANRSTEPGMGM